MPTSTRESLRAWSLGKLAAGSEDMAVRARKSCLCTRWLCNVRLFMRQTMEAIMTSLGYMLQQLIPTHSCDGAGGADAVQCDAAAEGAGRHGRAACPAAPRLPVPSLLHITW